MDFRPIGCIMPGLVPGIHALEPLQDVDGRDSPAMTH
jgi:hypothetical protein